ncbi:Heparan sulfate 2-O-sulfotransferase 1 [Nymphon striatum]|nr:Heparan sulfate 2-O-sulfotransferase 1 [Nymphon striatum]KAG1696484.1 Heparan sulfate 2-O-sulfotransferase 1 [Nymphon striatum]
MRLIYNRVPKCGSTTFQQLFSNLTIRNGFIHISSEIVDRRYVNTTEQMKFVYMIKSMPGPVSFDRHINYINFTKFNETQPIYINVVREPIDRLMSSFYYKKDIISNRLKNKNKSLDNEKYRWLNLWQGELNEPNDVTQPSHVTTFFDDAHSRIQTYDDCIKEQYVPDGCSFKFREPIDKKMVIPFFCGQSSECRLRGNKWALNMAKYNIENHYAVVGVLEHMDKTLSVLEKYLPAFFSGVSEIYQLKRYHLNKSDGKRMIKPENLKIAKSYLSSEYDLYNFVIQRLDIQFNKIHHD